MEPCSFRTFVCSALLICPGLVFYFQSTLKESKTNRLTYKRVINSGLIPKKRVIYSKQELIQMTRQDLVRQVCSQYPNMTHPMFYTLTNSLLVKDGENITMCKMAKVGTTTFATFLEGIGNLTAIPDRVIGQKQHTIRYTMGDNIDDLVNTLKRRNFFTFVFVRHPFDRLASAYEDKFRYKSARGNTVGNSFENFADFVIAELEHNGCPSGMEKCGTVNVHWRPFYIRCDFCRMKYDFIGKMETFSDDMLLLINQANLTNRVRVNETVTLKRHPTLNTIDNRTATYFSTLSRDVKVKLYNLYKLDFLLFGYSPDEY